MDRYSRIIRRTTSCKSILLGVREHVLDRRDERRVADDPQLAVDDPAQLGERSHAVLRAHFLDVAWKRFICLPDADAPS